VERRRHLLRDHPLLEAPPSLHLRTSGPGFAMHESLYAHDDRTRAIVEAIEAIGHEPGADELPGDDLVHFDFHRGQVLVHPDDPDRITAVVDWDGARSGDVAVDLAVLTLDLEQDAPDLAAVVEARLDASTEPGLARRVWAHLSLRTVDLAIRHSAGHDVHCCI